ncbi:unnamed protein product [Hermetia illucens]|uniref:Uncharacterized protein n=1 Tax=Hermetia illucens TaxID=343691 RepID=A0A7R8YVX0_HERIL|nr:unnamed protein product [Hermetia illucens]
MERMSNVKKMSEVAKGNILVLRAESLSVQEILARIDYSKSAVATFSKNLAETESTERKVGSRAHRKTPASEDRLLKKISLRDRFKMAEDVRRHFVGLGGASASTRTAKAPTGWDMCTPAR